MRWRRLWRAVLRPPASVITPGARWSVIVLFCVAIGLTAGSYALTVSAIHRSERAAASEAQLCQAGNTAREQQIGLWSYIIHISRPPPHETAAQRAQREKTVRVFLAHLHKIFAPRNCAHPSRTEPTP